MKKRIMTVTPFVLPLAIAAVFVCGSGCIYFNLLYNAENAFNTASAAHRKLLKDNPDSTIVLSPEVDNGYKKTIDKCNKVFEVYPKKKKWHDKTLYLMGKAYFFDGEYDRTIHSFKQLLERFPASPLVGEAYLYTGRAYLKKENLDKAEEFFATVLEKYPALNKNQEVDMLMAEIAIHREGKSQAIELLEKTYKTAMKPDKKLELAVKIAQLYKDMKAYDKAIAILESAPRPKDLPEQLFRVDFLRVSCYSEKGNLARAFDLLTVMLAMKPYVSHVPVMLLAKGRILDRLNKTDEAITAFKLIIETYSASDFVGNAWFELGRIYQVKKNDPVKAKECYDKASSLVKDASIKDLAAQRSKAMDLIAQIRAGKAPKDTTKSDTITPPDYKIGELYWLELDQPDSAFKHYCVSAGDTLHRALIPKALYSAAWIARYALADSVKADSLYKLLIKRFPANTYSRKAQEARGGPVTIMTRSDSALDAFHAAERMYWEDNNPEAAAEAYVAVYGAFGETAYGSRSLYAAAWIYDFVLDKNRTAKKLYELLCDSFPKSSYYLDAKPRLKTVSDTIAALKAQKKLPQRTAVTTPVASKSPSTASKKADSLSADTSQQKRALDIITDRDTTVVPAMPPSHSMPQAPIAVPPSSSMIPAAPVIPVAAPQTLPVGTMGTGRFSRDSSKSTTPSAKPDSILKAGTVQDSDTIGQ
jgi:tetratricopeptide (TPR) repeat protein